MLGGLSLLSLAYTVARHAKPTFFVALIFISSLILDIDGFSEHLKSYIFLC
jgi:hypothetical protein